MSYRQIDKYIQQCNNITRILNLCTKYRLCTKCTSFVFQFKECTNSSPRGFNFISFSVPQTPLPPRSHPLIRQRFFPAGSSLPFSLKSSLNWDSSLPFSLKSSLIWKMVYGMIPTGSDLISTQISSKNRLRFGFKLDESTNNQVIAALWWILCF